VTVGARRLEDGTLRVGWDGILTIEQHERLRSILLDPARRVGNSRPRRHLLSSGLLVCGECGAKMKGRQHGDRCDYVCPVPVDAQGCAGVLIRAGALEDLIVDATLARLSTPRLRQRLLGATKDDGELRKAYNERAELQTRAEALAELLGARKMTLAQFKTANEANRKALDAIDRRIKASQNERARFLDELPHDDDGLVRWWEQASLLQRHALIAAVLDHAVIAKGVRGRRGFQSDRVQLVWR
jgi:hypothetical protein